MESPTHSKPSKDKTYSWAPLIFFLVWETGAIRTGSPHQIYNFTWVVRNQAGDIINMSSSTGPQPHWPDLEVDLCKLALGASLDWGTPDKYWPQSKPVDAPDPSFDGHLGGCNSYTKRASLADDTSGLYVCPGPHRDRSLNRKCGYANDYYCAAWGCETTGDAWWKPTSSWDYITLRRKYLPKYLQNKLKIVTEVPNKALCKNDWCIPLVIAFTPQGKTKDWTSRGFEWGLRLRECTGGTLGCRDPGLTMQIQLIKAPVTRAQAIGPNLVLSDQKPPSQPVHVPPLVLFPNNTEEPTSVHAHQTPEPTLSPVLPGTGDRLLSLVQGAYLALNLTDPAKTRECWLCLVSRPPYYEGVAIHGNYTNHTSAPSNCLDTPQHRLTISEVSGQGLCVGKVPKTHQAVCNTTSPVVKGNYYLAASNGAYWACDTGLTPCISANVLKETSDFCVLIELWPRVTYHFPEFLYEHYEGIVRLKREPVSLSLALLLGGLTVGGIAAGVGTGASALAATHQFKQLQVAMHTDIKALEESVSALE